MSGNIVTTLNFIGIYTIASSGKKAGEPESAINCAFSRFHPGTARMKANGIPAFF
jgi:hypothetical protein